MATVAHPVIAAATSAAAFYEDIAISDEYKFEVIENDPIISKIKECVENYDQKISDFDEYRNIIRIQNDEFKKQIKESLL